MGLGDVQLRVEPGNGITGHRGAAVGVDGFRLDAVIGCDGVLDELPGEDPGLGRPDFPVDCLSRVNVDYHVEQVPVSAAGAFQLRDVPGPYFTGAGRQQLRLLPRRVARVRAAVAGGAALAQEPVHAGLRAQVTALVEQDRVRLRDRLVGEAGRVQRPQDKFLFFRCQLGGMMEFPSLPRRCAGVENLQRLCEKHLPGRFSLEVIDIYQQPALAAEGQIIAAPTLIKAMPLPLRRLVGDFSDANRVVLGLDLKEA